MGSDQKPVRSRGRPRGTADQQRIRILDAAEGLLTGSQGELTLRQVAMRAEVTPPLAHYYFGNREGLLRALVDERASPRIDELLATAKERAAQPVAALTRLMQRLTLLIADHSLVRRCLLLPAGQSLRDQLRTGLRELLQGAQTLGLLRADLPADYLADALLGLCLFAFLDTGAGGNPAERAAALTLQHVALLQDGIVRTQKSRKDSGSPPNGR